MFKVSQSKVKMWLRCRYAYHLKHVEKLTRKRVSRPLQFGRLVHSMIEAYANAQDPFEVLDNLPDPHIRMFRAEREQYGDILDDISFIMRDYFDHWPEDSIVYTRHQKRYAEHRFEIELADGILFTGIIDAMARAKHLRWLVEHKTFTRMPNDDSRWRNVQSVVYIRAIDILGWKPVHGTLWDYIRSKPPARPQLLKSGKLSQKRIDSLPSAVRHELTRNKLSISEYREFIELMKKNRSSYFHRVFTPISRSVVDQISGDFLRTAREMSELHGKARGRSIDLHCDYCDYNSICRAELQGSDVDFVKEREYTKNGNEAETHTDAAG